MNLETIEKLVKMMEQHGLTELSVHEGDLEFKARRGERPNPPLMVHSAPMPQAAPQAEAAPVNTPTQGTQAIGSDESGRKSGKATKEITSPIVGTFYRRPNPNAPAYKEAGEHVEKGEPVCIVEAMKVMNEIQS